MPEQGPQGTAPQDTAPQDTAPQDTAPQDTAPQDTGETSAPAPRRGPELLTLVTGLGALGVATTALLGGIGWFPDLDGRWVLAALALIVGMLLVIGSLRPQQR